jgi:peptidoglycan hydrolase CwlO-like protein
LYRGEQILSEENKNKKDLEKELQALRKKFEEAQVKGTLLDALLRHIPDRIYFGRKCFKS